MELTEAYDLKLLLKHLKDQGLDMLEEGAKAVYLATKEWAKESAKLSKNPWDDLAIPYYDKVDAIVLPQIDKLDGKVG